MFCKCNDCLLNASPGFEFCDNCALDGCTEYDDCKTLKLTRLRGIVNAPTWMDYEKALGFMLDGEDPSVTIYQGGESRPATRQASRNQNDLSYDPRLFFVYDQRGNYIGSIHNSEVENLIITLDEMNIPCTTKGGFFVS